MNYQEYLESVKSDAIDWIEENKSFYEPNNLDELPDMVERMMGDCIDTISGNGDGSYYYDRNKAEQDVMGIIWHKPIISEVISFYGEFPSDPESLDVLVRYIIAEQEIDLHEMCEKALTER